MPLVEGLAFGHAAGVSRVFVAGEKQTGGTVMREAPAGVHVFVDGQYPTISDGTVSVHYLAQWFGEAASADDGATLSEALTAALRRSWGDRRLTLFANPAATGIDLWARTIRGRQWPVMSDQAQAITRRVTGQGRIELFAKPDDGYPQNRLVVLHEYDMRLAYLAGVRNLPVGEPVAVDEMSGPYAHGRYLVSFEGPAERVGVIAVPGSAGGYSWPASGGPVWTTGEELELARRWGIAVTVHEGFEWPQTGDPLRLWSERLLDLHAVGGDLAGALRAIMLHTIGSLHGAPRRINVTGGQPPAEGAERIRQRKEGGWAWVEIRPPRNPTNSHPEWTTTIWARARRRLLDNGAGAGMLHVPAGQLVAARTDSFFTTAPIEVGDRNRAGSYRLKSRSQPTTWPATAAELLATKGNLDA